MDPDWLAATFATPTDVSCDEFGSLPLCHSDDPTPRCHPLLGYMLYVDRDSSDRRLIPLAGHGIHSFPHGSFGIVGQHLGTHVRAILMNGGRPIRDRGLYVAVPMYTQCEQLGASTGWIGNPLDSFILAPAVSRSCATELIEDYLLKDSSADPTQLRLLREELEARQRPNYFHIIPALRAMIAVDKWPHQVGDMLHIPVPQRGLETELIELALLESLVEEAAAGDEQAQLLLTHIEEECATPIDNEIARQQSRLEWMRQAQEEQLRIHAEAVARAMRRGKITAANSSSSDGAAAAASSSSAASSALVSLSGRRLLPHPSFRPPLQLHPPPPRPRPPLR